MKELLWEKSVDGLCNRCGVVGSRTCTKTQEDIGSRKQRFRINRANQLFEKDREIREIKDKN